MNKEEFLRALEKGLNGLPQDEIDGRLAFYAEMIDDRIEEGMSEAEAVAGIGTVEETVMQTLSEIPLAKLVKQKIKPRRTLRAWEAVLIALGFPVWFPLFVTAFAVILSVYIVIWALIISLWAIGISFILGALAGIAAAVVFFANKYAPQGMAMLGAGLLCGGLSIFMFFGCLAATKGMLRLTKKIALAVKTMFIRKENSK